MFVLTRVYIIGYENCVKFVKTKSDDAIGLSACSFDIWKILSELEVSVSLCAHR